MRALDSIFKWRHRMTAEDREAVRVYLRERMRIWKPEEQEGYTRCADIMLYYQQFRSSREIVRSWIQPVTRYMHRCATTWLERHSNLSCPEEAKEVYDLWQEYFHSGERWAREMDTAVELNVAGTPLNNQVEARNVSRLHKRRKQAMLRAERAQHSLITRFTLVVN